MRRRVLVLAAAAAVVVSGCSSDEEPVAATGSTPAGGATQGSSESAEPEVTAPDPSDLPTFDLPSDLPTGLPTGLPTDAGELGLDDDCEAIVQVLLDVTAATEDIATDPSAAGDLFAQISQDLRDAAAGSDADVAAATEALATVYDDFGAALATGDIPDFTALTSASTDLQEACGA